MKFTPNHWVSYKGGFYAAGQSFEIDPSDADEMMAHGTVEESIEPEPVVRRAGRTKKNA